MKNSFYFIAAFFFIAACQPSPSSKEKEPAVRVISVMPIDRELYEYYKEITGNTDKELESFYAGYLKENGEEFPATAPHSVIDDPDKAFIRIPRPGVCLCPPGTLLPPKSFESIGMEDITFKVIAADPSLVTINVVNEFGEEVYSASSFKDHPDHSKTFDFRVNKIKDSKGKEFLVNVVTNYLLNDQIVDKTLQFTVSEPLL